MKITKDQIQLSAGDLIGHLNCDHLTSLNVQVANRTLNQPDSYDPLLQLLHERGQRHEDDYIEHLRNKGCEITIIDGVDISDSTVEATKSAMVVGDEYIVQAALKHQRWVGRADILRRVETPSSLGPYSYEIIDTKLARETKGGTVLQLCLYADLLTEVQGCAPEYMYVVSPWSNFEPQEFRFADYSAYYRGVKSAAEVAVDLVGADETYPEPKTHCDVCRWQRDCEKRRRNDDHLCLVAGISKNQIKELSIHNINTTKEFASWQLPEDFKPDKGSVSSFEKVLAQASIQVEAREAGHLKVEFLEFAPETGLSALPEPNPGDIFFDIESDQFVGEHGIEYLFGFSIINDLGEHEYVAEWALDRVSEKAIFERFIDFVCQRRQQYPAMHIFHFGGYEAGALKRLMGRYATRENEVDNLLRGLVLVDLLSVTKNAIRASVESYSLKQLEKFCGYERKVSLHDANVALTQVTAGLELNNIGSISDEAKSTVEEYNADDCYATLKLRDWLEHLRSQKLSEGAPITRPAPGYDEPSEELTAQQKRIQELIEILVQDVPVDPAEQNSEQNALWLLAHILDWHRRENKAIWWEKFRLQDLNEAELYDEKAGLSGLSFLKTIAASKTGIPTDRYSFDVQDTDIRGGEGVHNVGGAKLGTISNISFDEQTIDLKKSKASAEIHPEGIFVHKFIDPKEQAASLLRLGEYVAENGILGEGPYKSSRDLLLRCKVSMESISVEDDKTTALSRSINLATSLTSGVLPIQGPPGTGKSFTGARIICELVRQGKRVGITANSHKVIRNLLDKTREAAVELGVDLTCVQKPEMGNDEPNSSSLIFAKNNEKVLVSLNEGTAQVAGATHFFWCREDAFEKVDVLVVDEAGQMSLANVLAVSHAAQTVILLGDPQQLEQPTQGTHPDGTGVSALDHLLNGRQTIASDEGLFLGVTFRLHPKICSFISEMFYENKLTSVSGCENQTVDTRGKINGPGLFYLPVPHSGNTSSSVEEATAVHRLVTDILKTGETWTDRGGTQHLITLTDIVLIAPYNAQVFEIQKLLPTARVGTVDKFQGQEAPIAIFSMATSSYSDAPRGMEFLYSSNRFNVAISRAQCAAVLVASDSLFDVNCMTPRQMQLANSFCRYLELSQK